MSEKRGILAPKVVFWESGCLGVGGLKENQNKTKLPRTKLRGPLGPHSDRAASASY